MKGDYQWKLNQSKNDNSELIEKLENLIKLRSQSKTKADETIDDETIEQARMVLDKSLTKKS